MTALKPITNSSQIAGAGYDAASRTLSLQFKHSAFVYHYQNVPPETAEAFDKAESRGKAFGALIKDKFSFEKVDTAASEEA